MASSSHAGNKPAKIRLVPAPSLSFVVLSLFLGILWIAGGASRGDVLGQVVVRAAAYVSLVSILLWGPRPMFRATRPVLVLLLLSVGLALLQLVPLPPELWQALPGRAAFVEAARASGQAQPWRPLSIVPAATINAASSLVVPLCVLVLMASLKAEEHRLLLWVILAFVVAAMMVGLLQVTGAGFRNPLVNSSIGQVSGTFANRNHLALFLSFGCLLAPVWAFLDAGRPHWRGPVAAGLVLLFVLTILASGSRAGLLIGVLGLAMGLVLVRQRMRRVLGRYPRWVFPAAIAGTVGMILIFVLISVVAGRASSIDRVFAGDAEQDMRIRALPTVLAMIRTYFPAGSGLGGFDPIFRMHEPFGLLKLTYFNHAHNDLLEFVLDAGLPGLLLLVAGLSWWVIASARAWRDGSAEADMMPRLGSAMLLLVVIASTFDYPARTPMIMALTVIAGMWLSGGVRTGSSSALPRQGKDL